jgi:predicted nuclease with TOPRIM domain
MRYVTYEDRNGYLRRTMIRDEDDDSMAENGVPAGPPNLEMIDCEVIKREINNLLVKNNLYTWNDIQHSPVGLSIVQTVVKRHVASYFKEQAKRDKRRESSQ